MRIALQHAAIHESAGIALIRIADYVFLSSRSFEDGAPLQARWIACAAPTSQAALHHLLDHLSWQEFGEHVDESAVTGGGNVIFNPFGIDNSAVFQNDFGLTLEKWSVCGAKQPFYRLRFEAIENLSCVTRRNIFVEHAGISRNQRSFRTQPHASHALGLAALFQTSRRNLFIESILNTLALAGQAPRCDTDVHPARDLCLRFTLRLANLFQFFGCHCGIHLIKCSRKAWVVTLPATSWS